MSTAGSDAPGPVGEGIPNKRAADIGLSAVRRQFERRAAQFQAADYLHRTIANQMEERLAVVRMEPDTILDIGCGHGHGLQALGRRYPRAARLGIDVAEPMALHAGTRMSQAAGWQGKAGRWIPTFRKPVAAAVCADTRALPLADSSVNLIWSNLCLHWVPEQTEALEQWYRVIKPDGLVVFSMFGVDTLAELRGAGAALMTFPDMHDVGDALVGAGFVDPVMDMDRVTLEFSDPAVLLKDLHALGGNALIDRFAGLRGRQSRAQWLAQLAQIQRRDGRYPITIEICFGHAWCGPRKKLPEGLAPIDFRPMPTG